jgi:hypothetical protein
LHEQQTKIGHGLNTVSAISQLTMMWLVCIAINATIITAITMMYRSAFDGDGTKPELGLAAI